MFYTEARAPGQHAHSKIRTATVAKVGGDAVGGDHVDGATELLLEPTFFT